ncbi:hypothetical protein VTO42DRAFT_3073 [Malbranchea cinnamomea]
MSKSQLLNYILSTEESFRLARLPSLYSDFSLQRHTNPDGYASNIAAWQRALSKAALAGLLPTSHPSSSSGALNRGKTTSKSDTLVLRTSNALMAELETSEWGRPVALQSVIDESVRHNVMIPLQTFLTSATSPFRRSWLRLPSPPSLSQVASWGMKQVRGLVVGEDEQIQGSGRLQVTDVVLVDNLKEAAKRVEKVVSSHKTSSADKIYSKELFMKEFANIFGETNELSMTDFEVLLTFLSRDQNSILYDGKTVKFRSANDKSNVLTHEDQTIASLKTLISNLTTQTASLDTKIKEYTLAAQNALNNKNRVLALSALRSRKLAEQNLKQRSDTLLQLEEIYAKIEQAADQVDVINVMKASTSVLRTLHAQVGGVEKVEDVVEELRREMANVEDVSNVISEPAQVIDEGELDEELQAMETAEREAAEEKEAEITRQRLAELDKLEKEATKKPPEAGKDQELEESIDRLSHMSLEETRPQKA